MDTPTSLLLHFLACMTFQMSATSLTVNSSFNLQQKEIHHSLVNIHREGSGLHLLYKIMIEFFLTSMVRSCSHGTPNSFFHLFAQFSQQLLHDPMLHIVIKDKSFFCTKDITRNLRNPRERPYQNIHVPSIMQPLMSSWLIQLPCLSSCRCPWVLCFHSSPKDTTQVPQGLHGCHLSLVFGSSYITYHSF